MTAPQQERNPVAVQACNGLPGNGTWSSCRWGPYPRWHGSHSPPHTRTHTLSRQTTPGTKRCAHDVRREHGVTHVPTPLSGTHRSWRWKEETAARILRSVGLTVRACRWCAVAPVPGVAKQRVLHSSIPTLRIKNRPVGGNNRVCRRGHRGRAIDGVVRAVQAHTSESRSRGFTQLTT